MAPLADWFTNLVAAQGLLPAFVTGTVAATAAWLMLRVLFAAADRLRIRRLARRTARDAAIYLRFPDLRHHIDHHDQPRKETP